MHTYWVSLQGRELGGSKNLNMWKFHKWGTFINDFFRCILPVTIHLVYNLSKKSVFWKI